MDNLFSLNFKNRFINDLPGDPVRDNYTREVVDAFFSYVQPQTAPKPYLISYSVEAASLIDLSVADCESEAFLAAFSGNQLLAGMQPYACCYGGHQFGHWAGQLGDGRAINLGEVRNKAGDYWTLQLKGAGPTPYSRMGDGFAVLRSSVREYLCSEAMHALGIPTTRALCLIGSGKMVMRDMFYDGHEKAEPGAVVTRVAPSFTRFGSFEVFAARGDIQSLKKILDYTVRTEMPTEEELTPAHYLLWFESVCKKTAALMVDWMRVGFVHGVMNTDNMSSLGLTIDYGPYGWLEAFDNNWTPNTTDAQGRRYCYGNQSNVALWNLMQLANAIFPLVNDADGLRGALNEYKTYYEHTYHQQMCAKLGLSHQLEGDGELLESLLVLLQEIPTDMTIFFRRLASVNVSDNVEGASHLLEPLMPAYYAALDVTDVNKIVTWLTRFSARVQQEVSLGVSILQQRELMNSVNPKYVLRNYLAQNAIEKAEVGDYSEIERLLNILRNPFDEQPENEAYAKLPPEWAKTKPGCAMLSCSS